MKTIELIYKRPPNRVNHFQQRLLYEDKDVIITTQRVKPSNPIVIDGVTVLGDDFPVVWFVFADKWYDVGKVYNLQEQFTGYYCDIIMPMTRTETHFEITDLFLDVWISPDGDHHILDEDEFESAIKNNAIGPDLANQARNALQNLIAEVQSGNFPPEVLSHWELVNE
jgi:predicted RNA-binding protein associated with RNAse of E/G family